MKLLHGPNMCAVSGLRRMDAKYGLLATKKGSASAAGHKKSAARRRERRGAEIIGALQTLLMSLLSP